MNFDKTKYKVWTWKSPMVLHWILNPGLMVNELILGQRIPKITLIEKDKSKPLAERSFIPCPHCQTLHSGLKWTPQNNTVFRNWFGLYCDHCKKIIPCVRNLTSLLVIILTAPHFNSWHIGLKFGINMFILMNLFEYFIQQQPVTWLRLIISFCIYMVAGMFFGMVMKLMFESKNKKPDRAV